MKGDNAKQLSAELSTIIRRFAKRNGLDLRGHVRIGNTILWANYGGIEPQDPLLLSAFLEQMKGGTDGNNAGRSTEPETGRDDPSLR